MILGRLDDVGQITEILHHCCTLKKERLLFQKTIVITGASSGIGFALAEYLASLGHHVIAVARRPESLETLQRSFPFNITPVIADVTQPNDRLAIKNALTPEDTGIFLIHNTGVASPRLLSEISEEEWEQHYLTNTKTPLFLTQLLLPHLKNGGRVLNISSGLAHTSSPAMGAYGISKAALLMMKEYFNTELNDQGIRFASAMPGVVDTPIQTYLRSCDSKRFPAVNSFHGFFQRGELLQPKTATKFLSWLLLQVDDEQFTQGDWTIYDVPHHQHWALPGEVVQRKKTNQELLKEKENTQPERPSHNMHYSFYLMCLAVIITIIINSRLHNSSATITDRYTP